MFFKKSVLIICVLFFTSFSFAKDSVTVSSNEIMLGESVDLIYSSSEPISFVPDAKAFNQYFTLAGQSSQNYTTINNGLANHTYQINLKLFPKKVGSFTIGPFDFNGGQFKAIKIEVVKQKNDNMPSISDQIVFESTLSTNTIYQGESILYTVKLIDMAGLVNAEIIPPSIKNVKITQIDKDDISTEEYKGKNVRVFMRHFLLTPEKAGVYTLPASTLRATLPAKGQRQGFFNFPDMFSNSFFDMAPGKETFLESKPLQLTVNEKPDSWQGWWLPSSDVKLTEKYSNLDETMVGNPIERTVLLTAKNIDVNQLPLLKQDMSPDFKSYSNPEKRQNTLVDKQLIGSEEVKFVLIPLKSGTVMLPEIKVNWFDTITGQKQTAILPAKEINVKENAFLSQPTSPNYPKNESIIPAEKQGLVIEKYNIFMLFALFVIFVIFVLIILVLWLKIVKKHQLSHLKSKSVKKKILPDLYPFD